MSKKTLISHLRNIPDYPMKGVQFKDVTSWFMNPDDFTEIVDSLYEMYKDKGITKVCGVESRGFIIGAALAYRLGAGFILIRKPGKLPYEKVDIEYKKEYGFDRIEMHKDSIQPGQKVVLVDDLIATGGTMEAAAKLVEKLGGEVVKMLFLMELEGLEGRKKLAKYDVASVVSYPGK